jgi:hypothetical protein
MKNTHKDDVFLSVRIPKWLGEALDARKESTLVPTSAFIRQVLTRELGDIISGQITHEAFRAAEGKKAEQK